MLLAEMPGFGGRLNVVKTSRRGLQFLVQLGVSRRTATGDSCDRAAFEMEIRLSLHISMWVTPATSSKCPILSTVPFAPGISATNAGSHTITGEAVIPNAATLLAAIASATNHGMLPAEILIS